MMIESYFNKELSITIDQQCKDVARGCFISHDPEAYLSENPSILGKDFIDKWKEKKESLYLVFI